MGGWRFASLMFGFVAAVLVSAASDSVHAQTIPNDPLSADGYKLIGPTYPTTSSRPGRTTPKFQPLDEGYAAPGIPPPIPESDPTQDPEERDLLDPGPRAGQRPVVKDGDLNYALQPASPVDGNLETYTEEPAAPIDGVDTSLVDTRDASDVALFQNPPVALFQNPPAPPDPLLYQIEDLDPIRDDRTISRLFRQEPYDPVGIKVGSFVLFPELDFGTSYYSNVFHAPKAESDVALDLVPSARLVSNWSRHALEFRASGTLSWFNEYQTEDDKDYLVEARGRLDITRRANIQALLSRQKFFEDRSALDASSVGTRAEVLTDRAEAAYNQRFNRLSFQLRGSVNDYTYGDTETAGVVSTNDDRDYTAYEQTARVSWEFKPTLAPFVEVAINQREYSEPAASDGINRSSKGQRYRVGLSFGNTGRIWRGEIALGYGIQTYDDPRLHPVDGMTIDANATWRITDITSILFNASTDVSETTTTDVGGAFSYYASIELRHELQSYLVATAGLIYSNQNSQDGIIKDNEFRETLGLEYYANRNWILYGRYAHVNFDGVGIPNDYVGDEFHIGVKWRR